MVHVHAHEISTVRPRSKGPLPPPRWGSGDSKLNDHIPELMPRDESRTSQNSKHNKMGTSVRGTPDPSPRMSMLAPSPRDDYSTVGHVDEAFVNTSRVPFVGNRGAAFDSLDDDFRQMLRKDLMACLHEFFLGSPGVPGVNTTQANATAAPPTINRDRQAMEEIAPSVRFKTGDAAGKGALGLDGIVSTKEFAKMPKGESSATEEASHDELNVVVKQPTSETVVESETPIRFQEDTALVAEFSNLHYLVDLEYEVYKQIMPKSWARKLVTLMGHFLHENAKEPPHHGMFAKIVDHNHFNTVSAVVIVFNAMLMFFMTNHMIQNQAEPMPLWLYTSDVTCFVFFCGEILMKLSVHRKYYFVGGDFIWNWIDMILTGINIGDYIKQITDSGGGQRSGNYMFFRLMRILKMVKVLRVFRLMRFLSDLRLLLNSIIGSMISLFWSLVMISLICYVFSLVFVQQAIMALDNSGASIQDEDWEDVRLAFGSVQEGMLSLMMACTGGADWGELYFTVNRLGPLAATLFLFFIAFTQIAVLNILTGIFVENAMSCAEPDKDARYLEKMREQAECKDLLHDLCKDIDDDGSGTVNLEEFRARLHTDHSPLRRHFFEMGLRPEDAERFFKMITAYTEADEVDIHTFVNGLTKLKGGATSLDMQFISFQSHFMLKKIDQLSRTLHHLDLQQKKSLRAASGRDSFDGLPS